MKPAEASGNPALDHASDPNFVAYYEEASLSAATLQRFRTVRDKALVLLAARGRATKQLRVADIGCGAGTQSLLWAELGHSVSALDINAPLIEIAQQRAAERDLPIEFHVGSATALPMADASTDVCLLPELLEHVADWQACLREAARILDAGGLLYLSTTNALCPVQNEFNLPLYGWYPRWMKRRYERLAVTTRPELANYATYPAVNWFTFYKLRDFLQPLGFECLDRFEMIDLQRAPRWLQLLVRAARAFPPARLLGHVLTEGTALFAIRKGQPKNEARTAPPGRAAAR